MLTVWLLGIVSKGCWVVDAKLPPSQSVAMPPVDRSTLLFVMISAKSPQFIKHFLMSSEVSLKCLKIRLITIRQDADINILENFLTLLRVL